MKSAMRLFILQVFCFSTATAFLDDGACPSGWTASGDTCVRPVITPATSRSAISSCRSDGARLLNVHDHTALEDAQEVLESLYNSGLSESTWLVGHSPTLSNTIHEEKEAAAVRRNDEGKYRIISVSPSAAYPFVCALSPQARRAMLIQQQLMPTGAPRLVSQPPPQVYFHMRPDADYVVLPCHVSGQPTPKITWYRNEVEVVSPTSSANSSLLLSGGALLLPAAADLAYSSFHCLAENPLGTVRSPPILVKPAFLEPFARTRLDTFPRLNGGARLDCDAPSHEPKSHSFNWLRDDTTERIVSQDERIFVSLDGALYFSHVKKEDETSYACSLSLSSTQSGHYGPFFRLVVPAEAAHHSPPEIDQHQPQVFPESPVRGDTVYLECFAYGFPTPTYRWQRVDGRSLPQRATIINHGRVLRIERARESDAGRYRCTATNSMSAAHAEVHLSLKSPPSILVPLWDSLHATGDSIRLECPLSTGDMASAVEWFQNGRPLSPLLMDGDRRKRYVLQHNVLSIRDAVKSDSSVFECSVSNDIGTATSSARVTVKDSPPAFPPHAMPTKVIAVKGTTLHLPCTYQASPRGASKWTDGGGARIPHKGRIRDETGVLVIEHVQTDDAGVFFCTAHNRLGRAHLNVQLVVSDRPQVSLKEHRAGSHHGHAHHSHAHSDHTNITCEVELDCKNEIDCAEPLLSLDWPRSLANLPVHKSGDRVDESDHSREERKKKRAGRFPCSSLFGSSNPPQGGKTLPTSPISVKALQAGRDGVQLAWRMPPAGREARDHATPSISAYRVELRTREDRSWRGVPRESVGPHEADGVRLTRLQPNQHYQFRIRSVSSGQLGDPSPPTDWLRTQAAPPSEAVEGLSWRPLDANTLLVEWQPVETTHSSGSNLRYRVTWAEGRGEHPSDAPSPRRPAPSSPAYLESPSPSAIVRMNSSLIGCRMVVLAVQPVNDQGSSPLSTDTVAFLNANGQLRRVKVRSAAAVNATHASFAWEWDGEDECASAYAVQISCHPPDGPSVTVSVSANQQRWSLGGLMPSTEYECRLRPFDSRGHFGVASETVRVATMGRPPQRSPQITNLGIKTTDESIGYTTILEWTSIPFPVNSTEGEDDDDRGYKIFIFISETASDAVELSMPLNHLVDHERPSARLDGLRLMYTYTVQVAGYNSGGLGPLSSTRVIRLGSSSSHILSSANTVSLLFLFVILYLRVR